MEGGLDEEGLLGGGKVPGYRVCERQEAGLDAAEGCDGYYGLGDAGYLVEGLWR